MRTKKTVGGWLRSAILVLEAADTPAGFCKRLKFIFVILTTANWWWLGQTNACPRSSSSLAGMDNESAQSTALKIQRDSADRKRTARSSERFRSRIWKDQQRREELVRSNEGGVSVLCERTCTT